MTQTQNAFLERMEKLGTELRYAFYCMVHPADGFWCIRRDNRASVLSATVLLAIWCIINLLYYTLTNFQFLIMPIEWFNAGTYTFRIIAPVFLWSLANWGFTTLMEGKGRLSDIYVATVYAFSPTILLTAVGIVMSQVITYDEGMLYVVMYNIALIWSVLLMVVGMMQIHDYTLLKTIASSLLSIAGIGFLLFVFMLFFSLISDAIVYFISLANEIIFRFY